MFCERFIHVHVHRCGGSLVRELVRELLTKPGHLCVQSDAHAPLSKGREIYPDAPAFTVVRNPWDWWTSSWLRDIEVGRFNATFAEYLDGHRSESVWWYELGADEVPEHRVIRFEKLESGIHRVFRTLFSDLLTPDQIWSAIARVGHVRASRWRMPFPFFYREEWMVEEVARRDRSLIEQFGYMFPREDDVSFPEGLASGQALTLIKKSLGLRCVSQNTKTGGNEL